MQFDDSTIQKLKKAQLELVLEVDRLCQKHNLRYFLMYGTLIGAIRHDGFIPWDDDLDIAMPYQDFVKLQEVAKTDLDTDKFFYQSIQTDPEFTGVINRLRRNNSLLIEEEAAGRKIHHGIFIDIYPIFGAAPEGFKRKLQIIRAMLRSLYLVDEAPKNHGKLIALGSKVLLRLKTKKGKIRAEQKLAQKISQYDFDTSEYVTALDSRIVTMKRSYRREWIVPTTRHAFEGEMLAVPCDSDKVLTKIYGDYMQLPPENMRKFHHNYLDIQFPPDFE